MGRLTLPAHLPALFCLPAYVLPAVPFRIYYPMPVPVPFCWHGALPTCLPCAAQLAAAVVPFPGTAPFADLNIQTLPVCPTVPPAPVTTPCHLLPDLVSRYLLLGR